MVPLVRFVLPTMVPGLFRNMKTFSAVLVDHAPSSWRSNEVAPSNILFIFTTFDTFQLEMSPLNELASENI